MMTPDEINTMTLEALREARMTMMSAEWQLEMDAASAETRRQSGLLLGMVQGEILRLENLQLATVASSLAANGAKLAAASADVKKELKKIANVAKILKTVDQLVKLAIKVAPKLVGLMGAMRRAPRPGSIPAKRKSKPATKAKKAAKPKQVAKAAARPAAKRKATVAAKPRAKAGARRRVR